MEEIYRPRMTETKIQKFLSLAKNASTFSDFKTHHLGAVLVYKGKILSIGYNTNKTNPIQQEYNKFRGYDVTKVRNSLHAECFCLIKCKKIDIEWNKAILFVYREHKNGEKALAKPCPACAKMIRDMGIKDVYYTIEKGVAYERYD